MSEPALHRDWDAQIAAADGDEVAAAVGILRCSQRAHQSWIDYRAEDGDLSHCSNCGRPYESETPAAEEDDFDHRCVEEYEQIIGVIVRLQSALLVAHPAMEILREKCVNDEAGAVVQQALDLVEAALSGRSEAPRD